MTEIGKQKASIFGIAIYRILSLLGIFILVFNIGVWKKEVDSRGFKSPEQRYETLESVKDNTSHRINGDLHMPKEEKDLLYVKQEDFDKSITNLIESINRIEKKIDTKYIN